MSAGLRFIPPRVAIVDAKGMVTREWYLFFQGVFDRIGGSDGPSIPDVTSSLFEDAGSGETNALLFSTAQALALDPPATQAVVDQNSDQQLRYEPQVVDQLMTEVAELREQLAVVLKELDALRQNPSL